MLRPLKAIKKLVLRPLRTIVRPQAAPSECPTEPSENLPTLQIGRRRSLSKNLKMPGDVRDRRTVPVKLISEAETYPIDVELKNGDSYRGVLKEVEDTMNVLLESKFSLCVRSWIGF